MNVDVDAVVARLGMKPHPEGGFYRETFRSQQRLEAPLGTRAASTAIYYLLPAGALGALHRVRSDEVWHFYSGQPLTLHLLDERGTHREVRLGPGVLAGEEPQIVVPAGVWQAAIGPARGHTLCGCTVAPGFEFADFEMPTRAEMRARFPEHASLIDRVTR
jgi:predicted cupin superfamily sugar epimerase